MPKEPVKLTRGVGKARVAEDAILKMYSSHSCVCVSSVKRNQRQINDLYNVVGKPKMENLVYNASYESEQINLTSMLTVMR